MLPSVAADLDFDGHDASGTNWDDGTNKPITPPYSIDSNPEFSTQEKENIVNIWKRVAEVHRSRGFSEASA